MEKNKWLFPGVDIEERSLEFLTKQCEYVACNFTDLMNKFLSQFEEYCLKISQQQEAGIKAPLAYINFSVLGTNILAKRHQIRMDAYDKNWYADKTDCIGEYDVPEFFTHLEEYSNTLEKAGKSLFGHGKFKDVQDAVFDESKKYLQFVAEFLRIALRKASTNDWYQKVQREALFTIFVGEYQGSVDIIYKEDFTDKDAKIVKQYLESKELPTYYYEINENLNLSQGDYQDIHFHFSSFSGSDFSDSNLKNATLLFCNFSHTVLANTNMESTQIFDTDFRGAFLENVSFKGAHLKHLSFADARLINVDFEGVLLAEDLDFSDAQMIKVVLPLNLSSSNTL